MALPALLLLAALAPVAMGAPENPYCANQPYWLPDGSIIDGGPNWSSYAPTSAFLAGPCLGLSGIGMTETFKKTIIVIDRSASENGYLFLPGQPENRAYASELNLANGKQRGMNILTNPFCSSGQHTRNGTLISIGGDWNPADLYTGEGEFSIRGFEPCDDGNCGFKIVAQLARSRWYPASALLGDGRVIIVGGSAKGVGLNFAPTNVPFIEYYPRDPLAANDAWEVDFLTAALPYNLFPFVHVLPSGRVFMFAGDQWILWDTITNAPVPGDYPAINELDAQGNPLRFSYPLAATSVLFPLTPANKYTPEIMICGGSGTKAIYKPDPEGEVLTDPWYPTSNKCFRILPELPTRAWVPEAMKLPRVDANSVLLPDGHVFISGGCGTGISSLGVTAHNASLTPEMYDTTTHTWYKGVLATSKIPRSYHSSAVLLHSGAVFLTGSNPNSNIIQGKNDFPIEFRTEYFHAPYMMPGVVPPVLLRAPATAAHGAPIGLAFKYAGIPKTIKVVLIQPGYSTHGSNHGQRMVELAITARRVVGRTFGITAVVPVNKNLLPPTWYWVFVVVNGIPNRDGNHIMVQ